MNLISSIFSTNKFYPEPSCAICLEEYSQIEENRCLKLICGHLFHQHCVEPWLKRHNSCPSCRVECHEELLNYTRLIEVVQKNRKIIILSPQSKTLLNICKIFLFMMFIFLNPHINRDYQDFFWSSHVKPYIPSDSTFDNCLMGAAILYTLTYSFLLVKTYRNSAQTISYKPEIQ